MKRLILIPIMCIAVITNAQVDFKKIFKFSTFYASVNGGNSISDVEVFSVTDGLETFTIKTPYDYNLTLYLYLSDVSKYFISVKPSSRYSPLIIYLLSTYLTK